MARDALSKQVADQLTQAIIAGEYEVGALLPSETELAARFEVSRLTVREAVKVLRAANLVEVKGGRGTRINPIETWTDLSLLVQAERAGGGDADVTVSHRLIDARRLIERGSAEMAAANRGDDDLAELAELQTQLEAATAAEDLDRFVEVDLAFHRRVMDSTGNVFIGVLYDPLRQVLEQGRRQTSAVQEIREHAAAHHRAILEAIEAGDVELAGQRMDAHMNQTAEDLDHYIFGEGGEKR
jgi:GntR family transcriptional regulator, transcriptional repressor for pyruvate dehydrogenase complex